MIHHTQLDESASKNIHYWKNLPSPLFFYDSSENCYLKIASSKLLDNSTGLLPPLVNETTASETSHTIAGPSQNQVTTNKSKVRSGNTHNSACWGSDSGNRTKHFSINERICYLPMRKKVEHPNREI